MDGATDLLRSRITSIGIEVTSKCNLRCAYCAKADKIYEALSASNQDLTDEDLSSLYQYCRQAGIRHVSLSGIGETAMLPGWHNRLVQFLNDPDMKLHLVSNFTRILADDDLLALTKFDNVQVSFDSADPALVRKLRSKADIRTIIYNIVQLRAKRAEIGYGPTISVNCTLCRDVIGGLDALARLCVAAGVDRLILGEVMKMTQNNQQMPGTMNDLSNDEIALLVDQLVKVEEILRDSQVEFYPRDTLRLRTSEIIERRREGRPDLDAITYFKRQSKVSACRQPWEEPFVRADGKVYPCCTGGFSVPPVGDLSENSLDDILDSSEYRKVRASILAGAPTLPCSDCLLASAMSFSEFKMEIMRWQGEGSTSTFESISNISTANWRGLFGNGEYSVTFENTTFELNGPEANLVETPVLGYHRLFVDLMPTECVRIDVTPAGRRNLRVDFMQGFDLVGRVSVRLLAQPRLETEIGAFEGGVRPMSGGSYCVELPVPADVQPSQLIIFLARDDGAVLYSGDHRCGIQLTVRCG